MAGYTTLLVEQLHGALDVLLIRSEVLNAANAPEAGAWVREALAARGAVPS